ncbi:MAG: tRNA lysidine(34) synthetase TilS [Coriobacteriia bacterium]|nr:tRNA lysidine(34) synthetase TilS [Coriobacteriia bacterium]
MELLEQIKNTIERYALYDQSDRLLLLVSGGADSTTLLHAFASGELPAYRALEVLHVNHQLRREESDGDEQFVRDMCRLLDIPCHVFSLDLEAYATQHELNLEDAGRVVRYEQAREILCESGAKGTDPTVANGTKGTDPTVSGRIVTAHTLDDRIETFFWRALWGAGTGALGSIAPKRDNIIRPLISSTREQIINYLTANDFAWREDATNEDTTRTRAAIRHKLIPIAEEIRPTFRRSLERTMDLAAADNVLLERMEQAFARDFTLDRIEGEMLIFDVPLMRTLEPTMRARTVRCALFETFPEARRLDGQHIDAVVAGIDCDTFARDLGYGLRASSNYGTLKVTKHPSDNDTSGEDGENE